MAIGIELHSRRASQIANPFAFSTSISDSSQIRLINIAQAWLLPVVAGALLDDSAILIDVGLSRAVGVSSDPGETSGRRGAVTSAAYTNHNTESSARATGARHKH